MAAPSGICTRRHPGGGALAANQLKDPWGCRGCWGAVAAGVTVVPAAPVAVALLEERGGDLETWRRQVQLLLK